MTMKMKCFALTATVVAIVLGTLSCDKIGGDDNQENPYKRLELTTRSAEFASQANTFAFDFISRVDAAAEGDYIISPLSMQFLLGMILDGARGTTADEICNVLGYGAGEVDAVNEYSLSMLQQLPKLDKKTKLSIANAIVVNKRYPLLADYKATVSEFYDAEVTNMDFSDVNGAVKKINKWCSDHTNGLVPKILDEVRESDLAYLMNAMYFKSQWKEKFPKGNTSKEAFTTEGGARISVDMMKNNEDFMYQENDDFSAVCLPYGNGAYSMTVILPEKGKTLSEVVQTLDGSSWNSFINTMVGCKVDIWLPKFETKYHIKLNDILSAMGMPSSFDAGFADFKAMSDYALCLSFVQQDAIIKVDEEGSEAAVVSSAGMMATSVGPGTRVVFHADRPFLYLITESSTRAILFAGKFGGE